LDAESENLLVTIIGKRNESGAQWRRAARAVLKTGLNLHYLKHGPVAALDASNDPLRGAILGSPYQGYLLIGEFDPLQWPNLSLSLLFDVPGIEIAVRFQYGGLDLLADLTLGPPTDVAREWAIKNNYRLMEIPLDEPPDAPSAT
jgi:hypothetical protein